MQQYSYKSSGIEWLGEVPEHWKVTKLKRVLSEPLKYGANESAELEDTELPRYIRITDFGDDGKLKDATFKSLPEEVAKLYPLAEGDLLFARSGATVGKTFQFKNYKGRACYAGYLIKASPSKWQLDSDFLYFFTKSIGYDEWKNLIFTQATIQNIGADKYQYLPIPLPPLPEQKAIAEYLDKACARIDRIIAIKEEQLRKIDSQEKSKAFEILTKGINDNVPMKNSEIHWMDKMPSHWRRLRLKDVIFLRSGDSITSTDINEFEEFPVYGGNGLRGYTDSYTHEGYYPLIGRQGALCGNINYAVGKFYASEHAVVATPVRKCDVYWIGELMRIMNLNQYSNAAAQPGLAVERIKQLYIPYPTFDEQVEISVLLKDLFERNSRMKKLLQSQITTLQSYRKSLIHECVTGKKQVADVARSTIQEINA